VQAEDFGRLPPAPREIPLAARLLIRLRQSEGALALWALLALAGSALAANTDWRSLLFTGTVERASGRVVRVERGNWQELEKEVSKASFEFERGGATEAGASYFVGAGPEVGEVVRIEYPVAHPSITRIEGGRTAPLSRWMLTALIPFGAFPLLLIRVGWRRSNRILKGMGAGKVSLGGSPPGLVDAETGELLFHPSVLPVGLEVGLDGAWRVDSSSRLTRPVVFLLVAGGALSLLIRGFFE
jgi:hypothetical protein